MQKQIRTREHQWMLTSWTVIPVLALLTLALPAMAQVETPTYAAATVNVNTHHFQDVYYIQPHNTYEHGSSLTAWLEAGFRSVELDVQDPGFWEFHPDGPIVAHTGSGQQNNCSSGTANDRLGHCLRDIVNFIGAESPDVPILLLVDMKGGTGSSEWQNWEVAFLDEYIRSFLGSTLYSFEDLYWNYLVPRGGQSTPRSLAAQHGWPLLRDLRSKVIVGLTGGQYGDVNGGMEDGRQAIQSIFGRYPATFLCPDVENDPSEVDVGGKLDAISTSNSQFFLCSNLKSRDHYQVTANRAAQNNQILHLWGGHVWGNTSYTYNYIAVAHGVQAVGRDLNQPWLGTTWGNSIPYVGVRRSLPGYFKLRPTNSTNLCLEVEGASYGNGSDLNQWSCHSGSNQRFVYTAEGQLRPRGNNKYCADIDGGDAGNGKKMHIWDCDGGASEKWQITPEGRFRSRENSGYCMDSTSSTWNGVQFRTYACSSASSQKFWLETVADWTQKSF